MNKTSIGFIILAVLVLNVLRFWKLDAIPNGYHINELGSAVTVQCLAESGCDAQMKPWPLFGAMDYGQDKPPTFIYPGMLWAKVFGSTVGSLRAYSVFIFMTGLVGLFLLGKGLFGRGYGLLVVLAATCSPWAWVATRLALESFFAPVLAIWGLYFLWRSNRWGDWAWAGLLFASAMYAYPPARLQIPLMMATLGLYEWGRRSLRWRSVLSLALVFIMSLLPLAAQYMHGALTRRFDQLSILNKDYLYVFGKAGTPWDTITVFAHHYLLHLAPSFLFFTGDASYMYSTRHSGILGILDMTALVILLVFLVLAMQRPVWQNNPLIKNRRWLLFLASNFFIGIIPSALTNQGLPHALRICGSWPFMMLFTGFMWWAAAECLKGLLPAMTLVGIFSGAILAYQYFTIYPAESKGEFGFWAKETAQQLKTPEDWRKFLLTFRSQKYHCRYFLAHGLGMTCKQADDAWQKSSIF